MVAHLVEVTDLAAMQQLEIGKIRLGYRGCHGIFLIKKITAAEGMDSWMLLEKDTFSKPLARCFFVSIQQCRRSAKEAGSLYNRYANRSMTKEMRCC
jgi:hypothetical protein